MEPYTPATSARDALQYVRPVLCPQCSLGLLYFPVRQPHVYVLVCCYLLEVLRVALGIGHQPVRIGFNIPKKYWGALYACHFIGSITCAGPGWGVHHHR